MGNSRLLAQTPLSRSSITERHIKGDMAILEPECRIRALALPLYQAQLRPSSSVVGNAGSSHGLVVSGLVLMCLVPEHCTQMVDDCEGLGNIKEVDALSNDPV